MYLDLVYETTDMWYLISTDHIPIVLFANTLIPLSLANKLGRLDICGASLPVQVQKTVMLDTSCIDVMKFLIPTDCATTGKYRVS